MADKSDNAVLYAAVYEDVESAQSDLEAFQQLHHDQMLGKYDAAVIDKEEGKPHIVKRADSPAIRVIPEWLGGGTLRRRELHELAQALDENEAELILVGDPTLEKGFDKAVSRASKTAKRDLDAGIDELEKELTEARTS